ncbi:MAG TPA: protein kinase [Polyangiales bacterium]|nr:protein kinase [Polyangiales bacterium]
MSQPIAADVSETSEIVAGRYRLHQKLARGGMGEVFAAVDQSSGASIALKRLLSDSQQRRTLEVHFMREYHALSELRHPRIIEVYDYGIDRGAPFYTMELLDGEDLGKLSPLPYRDACRYLRDVASSLALLHARRLLHRDLSPRNVRRTSDGRCKLLDFGAMVPFGVPPNLTGTPPCIAPEALQGAPLDQRSDLYSLGALAYFILTGRHAYPVSEIAALQHAWTQAPANPRRIARDLPDALDALVMSLLSLDPMKRPASAAEVIDWLSAAGELAPDDSAAVARSFLAGSQLVNRSNERAKLHRMLSQTLAGRGAAVLIRGELGSGRSRMLAEAALIGQTSGLTVVRAVARKQRGAASSLIADLITGLEQAAPLDAQRASKNRPVVQASRARSDSAQLESLAAAGGEARVQMLTELTDFFVTFARVRPLLIAIDDLDRSDEFSGALVAALADQTSSCALSVVASYDSGRQAPALANVRGLATTLTLRPLDRTQCIELIASLFGDVPNLERVSDWIYRVALGSPKLTLELAEHLLNVGIVRYVDGAWVLPAEIDAPIPPSAEDTLLQRLQQVSSVARELAEVLSVSRGGASAATLIELAARPPEVVIGALEELVGAGTLESAGEEYVFAQDALSKAVARGLDPSRRQQLHARWADRLLATRQDRDGQLEAGWHLVHTEQELRGADLLAKIGPDMVERRVSMATAVPAIERALEIYERHGRSLAQCLRLRSLLVMSSYLFDHKLAARYGDGTLDALYPYTGLAEVERWSRTLGRHLGLALGMAWAWLRWCLRRPAKRGPSVLQALLYYARSAMGLVGLAALTLDPPGAKARLARMRAFKDSPHPTLALVYSLSYAIQLQNEGRGGETRQLLRGVIDSLGDPRQPLYQMSQQERVDMLVGALLLDGIDECYREHSLAIARADELDRIGNQLAHSAALRVRMTYYIVRGEREATQFYRRQLDINAIQNGTDWQIDWIAVPIEGLAGLIWTDLVVVRRALDHLERMVVDAPSLVNMRDTMELSYHFRRRDYPATIKAGEAYIAKRPPFALLGWGVAYAMTAFSYLELNQPERALSICELASSRLTDEHRCYVGLYSTLEAAHAATLAMVGQRERAEQMFDALFARLRAAGEHACAFLMYEYRVKVARLVGDKPGMLAVLDEMREAALATSNPSVIALAERVRELHAMHRSSPLPPANGTPEPDLDTRAGFEETAVTVFLRRESQPEVRAQHALHMLGQYATDSEGYLFLAKDDALQLAASLDERSPPDGLEDVLARLPANHAGVANTVDLPGAEQQRYSVFPLRAGDARVGLAVLRDTRGAVPELPGSLLREIGRVLGQTS